MTHDEALDGTIDGKAIQRELDCIKQTMLLHTGILAILKRDRQRIVDEYMVWAMPEATKTGS